MDTGSRERLVLWSYTGKKNVCLYLLHLILMPLKEITAFLETYVYGTLTNVILKNMIHMMVRYEKR